VQFTVAPDRTGRLTVEGCEIAWAQWGSGAQVPIVLVHGASAHIGWWDAVIASLVASGRRVVALEGSGHGDSGHRDAYSGTLWAQEVIAVTREVAAGPSLLVGHSLGGRISILAGAREPSLFPRVVLVDAPVRRPGDEGRMPRPRRSQPRVHETLQDAVDAFRLRPREPVADAALLARVAAGAFKPRPGGWTLKADLGVFHRVTDLELADALGALTQPLTLVYGTMSAVVDADRVAYLREAHPGQTDVVALEGHHHLTFDRGAEVAQVIAERWALLG
jgi:pimeloyl-ACP methyl ester carboxylesterase